jgi:hypothetical protein
MECLLKKSYGFNPDLKGEKTLKYYQLSFIFCLIWGLGTSFYETY